MSDIRFYEVGQFFHHFRVSLLCLCTLVNISEHYFTLTYLSKDYSNRQIICNVEDEVILKVIIIVANVQILMVIGA